MKYCKYIMMAVLLAIVGRTNADNLSVSNIEMKAGETKDIAIALNNPSNKYAAFQFDLVLPDGIIIAQNDRGKLIASLNADRIDDHTLNVSDMGSNTYRFLSFSMTNAEFYGTSGTLVNVTLQASDNISTGSKTATVKSQVFTAVGGDQSKWSDLNFTIAVSEKAAAPVSYKLTYVVDGTTYKTYDIETGATIAPEAEPTKEGYTFSGWSEIPQTMPDHDVTVTGSFTVNKYKLTYIVDGTEYKSYDVEYGASITPEAAPTKEGYLFSGWSNVPSTMPARDVTIIGSFTKGAHTLTYVVDGETYKTVGYDYGEAVTPEAEPTREGYTFSGWSEIPQTMPDHDVTVTGSFTVNKYKLTYMVDGEVYKSFDLQYGAEVTPEAEPTKSGYTFSGWSEIPTTMPAYDVTVTGYFTSDSKQYSLIITASGSGSVSYNGSAIKNNTKTFSLNEGSTATLTFSPDNGYQIKDVKVNGSVVTITNNQYAISGINKDITVVVEFEAITYTLSITANGNGAATYDGTTIRKETSTFPVKRGSFAVITFSPDDGYIIKSVKVDNTPIAVSNNLYKIHTIQNITSDTSVEVEFESKAIAVYKLTYMVDGEVYKVYEMEEGAAITPEPEPKKEGYKFSGWSEIPETMPAKDVTVSGTFSIGTYKLTYMVDGEEYKTISYEYGATITAEVEPTKEGYTFAGWSEIPVTMPAQDVTVTGAFTINRYKLVYIVDGEVYKTYEIEYGTTITPETEPTKEGYSFSGWSYVPSKMPAEDVTVVGTFTQEAFIKEDVMYEKDGENVTVTHTDNAQGDIKIESSVVINGQTYDVTSIAEGAFQGCTGMTSVEIPNTVTVIEKNAFNGCTGLREIKIGSGVKEIGSKAFANIATSAARNRASGTELKVYCETEVLPSTAADAFENSPIENATLYVNDGLVNVYKFVMPWNKFGTIVGLSTGINSVIFDTEDAHIYDIQGNRLDDVRKGVNIIRTRDGKSKKVVIK